MGNWDYKRESSRNVTAGDHRFEVVSAEEGTSKSTGKPMIIVELRPNGAAFTVKGYFVKGEWFNHKVTQFFDSTGIEEGNFELATWVGAMGAARFKEDDQGYLKVHYYIDKSKAEKLPPWVGEMPERQAVTVLGGGDDDTEELDPESDPF